MPKSGSLVTQHLMYKGLLAIINRERLQWSFLKPSYLRRNLPSACENEALNPAMLTELSEKNRTRRKFDEAVKSSGVVPS